MLLKILDLYISQYRWLKFEEDYHLLGTQYKYRVSIEPIYIPRLKLEHNSILDSYNECLKSNVPFRKMVRRIDEVLQFNYNIRKPFLRSRARDRGKQIKFLVPIE